jgi:hypothetical protein
LPKSSAGLIIARGSSEAVLAAAFKPRRLIKSVGPELHSSIR